MVKQKRDLASKEILSTREAAALLKVTPQSIKNYIYTGKLKAVKTPGGHHRILRSALKDLGFMPAEEKDQDCISAIDLRESYDRLMDCLILTIQAFAKALDTRDIVSSGHSERVAHYAGVVGRSMGIPEKELRELHLAALLHDIGKIGISENILSKPGRLTDQEFFLVKKHSEIGSKIIGDVKLLAPIGNTIRHHHERFDGRGYPDEISGRDIDIKARIIAVADTYDFMRSDIAFRPAKSVDDSIRDLTMAAGTQFDPEVVRVFVAGVEAGRLH